MNLVASEQNLGSGIKLKLRSSRKFDAYPRRNKIIMSNEILFQLNQLHEFDLRETQDLIININYNYYINSTKKE